MNFLAHAYLSGTDPAVMVGNFIGDFVKGKNLFERYSPEIALGIELHRSIDGYTDSHHIVGKSKERLRPKYRHYSAVIVDMFYDHFLANNWSSFHEIPLTEFASYTYATLQSHYSILPDRFKKMFPYLVRGNWLVNYANVEGVHQALSGMAQRTTFHSRMEEAVHNLEEHYEDFKQEFLTFFPQLKSHAEHFLQT